MLNTNRHSDEEEKNQQKKRYKYDKLYIYEVIKREK